MKTEIYSYTSRFNQKQMDILQNLVKIIGYENVTDYLNEVFNTLISTNKGQPIFKGVPSNKQHEVAENYSSNEMTEGDTRTIYQLQLSPQKPIPHELSGFTRMLRQYFFDLDSIFDYCLSKIIEGEDEEFTVPLSKEELSAIRHSVASTRAKKIRKRIWRKRHERS